MERNNLFTDFTYKSYFSPLRKKVCVEVSFIYNNKVIKRYIFIDKEPNVDYIQQAKRIIKSEIESGKLEKYVKRYDRNLKPLFITIVTTLALAVAAGAGYLGYRYLSSGGGETSFTASIALAETIEGYSVSLTNEKVTKGKSYSTDINLTHPSEPTYCLPNQLEKVSVGGTTITDYTYTLSDPSNKASFTIPAESVTGKVEITIKLEKAQPTSVDIKGVDCVGCDVDEGQTAIFGASEFSFKVTLEPHYAAPKISKLKIKDTELTKDTDYKFVINQTSHEINVTLLNDKKVDGVIEITMYANPILPIGDTNIKLEADDLWLCDTHDFHLPSNMDRFDAEDGYTARIELPKPATTTNHVPLDIKVTAGNSVLTSDDYSYYFVDDEIAELVITSEVALKAKGVGFIITATSTPSIAQFIHSGAPGSVTLSFQATEEDCYLPDIDWGDDQETISTGQMEKGKTYSLVHTYKESIEEEKDHVINVIRGNGEVPQLIGFNANNDIRPGSDVYPDISAPLANYAEGTHDVKAARISNEFKGFIEEGLAYTAINSFCIPSSFTHELTESKHFANCSNLDLIYVASNNESMCSDDAHKLLFTKMLDNKLTVKVMANNKKEVVLEKYNDMSIVGVQSFAAVGRTVSSIIFGQYCDPDYMDYGLLACADVPNIEVKSNQYFITDDNHALVGVRDGIYSIYATTASTSLSVYTDANIIHLLPYSISHMMTEVNINKTVILYPYSIYSNSSLNTFTTGDVDFYGDLTSKDNPYHIPAIYNCESLQTVSFNSIVSTQCLTAGLIQKCPNVTSLEVSVLSDYYGASTNTIYYADGAKQGAAIVVATCSASLLADPGDVGTDWYINNFAPYVFNGNAFGTNCPSGSTANVYITEKVTQLSEYSCVGMSDNASGFHFAIASSNPSYLTQEKSYLDGKLHPVYSAQEVRQTLYLAVLEDLNTLRINVDISKVSACCMVSDPTLTTIELIDSEYKDRDGMEFEDYAFYNCPNLQTVDLSSLQDNYVPIISSTKAFIQESCTPFGPDSITVIVNPESVDEFEEHPVWSQFNIVAAK